MDARHFDAFVRSFTAGASRRGLVTGLVGGLLAALPTWSGGDGAARKGKKGSKGKKRRRRRKRAATGQACGGSCPAGETCCDGACIDTATDLRHCGSCSAACAANETCVAGDCNCLQTVCGDACVDTATNLRHCGTCGNRCTVNERCEAGVCMCGTIVCGEAFTCCQSGGCFCAGGFSVVFASPVGECVIDECPTGTQECIGPEGTCRACCPANSTCDPSLGVCYPV